MSLAGAERVAAYSFRQHARSPRHVAVLVCIYAVLLAAIFLIDAAWWLMALLALPTLPALWEVVQNPEAGLEIDETAFRWWSGKHRGAVRLGEIDHIRMDTRWDLSVRVRLMLTSGRRLQLPHDSLPPHRDLEQALTSRGLRVERHHFTVF